MERISSSGKTTVVTTNITWAIAVAVVFLSALFIGGIAVYCIFCGRWPRSNRKYREREISSSKIIYILELVTAESVTSNISFLDQSGLRLIS